MSLTFIRSVAGAALLAALAAGCGTAASGHSSAPKPAAAHPRQSAPVHAAATTPPARPATTAPAPPPNPIPQANAGDHDPDNNGAPSDGDGNL